MQIALVEYAERAKQKAYNRDRAWKASHTPHSLALPPAPRADHSCSTASSCPTMFPGEEESGMRMSHLCGKISVQYSSYLARASMCVCCERRKGKAIKMKLTPTCFTSARKSVFS
jgi:hypothetical protein